MNLAQIFQENFKNFDFHFDYPLSSKSYFKIGGNAEVFYEAKSRQEIMDLLLFCKKNEIKFTVIGGTSNAIIADEGLKGLTLYIDLKDFKILEETAEELVLEAGVGIKTSQLVMKAAEFAGTGLEGFIGVPGVLGGAIYNNAHYLNDLIADHIKEVEVLDLDQEEIVSFSREKCEFAYEQSIFQHNKNLIIISATFALKKGNAEKIKADTRSAIERRQNTQPLNLPSCGCVFRNPANTEELRQKFPQFADKEFIPAGFLIDQAGLKGTKEGDIAISDKHAAFFVNLGQGKAEDVKKLIAKVKAVVSSKFNVILEEEVFYLK